MTRKPRSDIGEIRTAVVGPMFYDYSLSIQHFSGGYWYYVRFALEPDGELLESEGVRPSLDEALGEARSFRSSMLYGRIFLG